MYDACVVCDLTVMWVGIWAFYAIVGYYGSQGETMFSGTVVVRMKWRLNVDMAMP
jgi:hypothetical protein